jgi:hypothetical protein
MEAFMRKLFIFLMAALAVFGSGFAYSPIARSYAVFIRSKYDTSSNLINGIIIAVFNLNIYL